MHSILSDFHRLADDPILHIRSLVENGKKPFAYFSSYFPIEIPMAFGYNPVRITGFNRECAYSDASLQAYCCSLARTSLDAFLAGDLNGLVGIGFTHSCDTLQRLPAILERHEVHSFLPVLNMPADLSSQAAYTYFRAEMEHFVGKFVAHAGRPLSKESLVAATASTNKTRSLWRRVADFREQNKLTFGDSMALARAATLLPRDEWNGKVETLLNDLSGEPARPSDGPRLFFWGGVFENRSVADLLEKTGARVTGDNLTTMSHDFRNEVPSLDDPIEALTRYYFDRPLDATKYREGDDRSERLMGLIRESKADAVIITQIKFCDPHAFDYPQFKRRLDRENIKSYLFEFDLWETGSGQAFTRLEAFVEMLRKS